MAKIAPFSQVGDWYRGNLHTHSTNSDGSRNPRDVCAFYRRRGYHFISLTDHFMEQYDYPVTDTRPYRRDGFTTIYGAELHAPATSLGDKWHVLAVGLPIDFAPPSSRERGPALAARASAAGAYVAVAHPAWYDLTDRDVLSVAAADAIEIFNTSCDASNGKGDSVGYLDRLLSQNHHYHAIATDDAHFHAHRPDWGRNWVTVRSRHLEPEALLEALRAGAFYSSQGPEIGSVERARGGVLRVTSSPVRTIRVTGASSGASTVHANADITSAELDLGAVRGAYARVTVIDRRGNRAWINPFPLT